MSQDLFPQDQDAWEWSGNGFVVQDRLSILPYTNLLQKKLDKIGLSFGEVLSVLAGTDNQGAFEWNLVELLGSGDWLFPGFGGESRSDCGTFYTVGCLDHNPAHVERRKNYCAKQTCPICFKIWLKQATEKIKFRLKEAKAYYKKVVHFTLSPPKSEWGDYLGDDSYSKARRKCIRIAKRVGIHGGTLVFHPYRKKCAECGNPINTNTKRCARCGSRNFVWYYSPHFHVLGFGWLHHISKNYDKTGWVVKKIGVRTDIGAVVYYILSHAGIRDGNNVVSWFGSLSWYHFKLDRAPSVGSENKTCPICGNFLKVVKWVAPGDNPLSDSKAKVWAGSPDVWEYLGGYI